MLNKRRGKPFQRFRRGIACSLTRQNVLHEPLRYTTTEWKNWRVGETEMGRSKQFNRDGDDQSVEKVVTKTGPLGLVMVFYIAAALLMILGVLFLWWRT